MPAFVQTVALRNPSVAHALGLELDVGEAEAIALAAERRADLVLVDEHRGRVAARRMGLSTMGLLGLLLLAKRRGVVPAIAPLLRRLEQEAGFWVGTELHQRVLADAGEPE